MLATSLSFIFAIFYHFNSIGFYKFDESLSLSLYFVYSINILFWCILHCFFQFFFSSSFVIFKSTWSLEQQWAAEDILKVSPELVLGLVFLLGKFSLTETFCLFVCFSKFTEPSKWWGRLKSYFYRVIQMTSLHYRNEFFQPLKSLKLRYYFSMFHGTDKNWGIFLFISLTIWFAGIQWGLDIHKARY